MPLSVAMLMDPISTIKIAKDTSFALLLEAQRRGHRLLYMEQGDLALRDGVPFARLAPLEVRDDPAGWYTLARLQREAVRARVPPVHRTDPGLARCGRAPPFLGRAR
jgi:glutathione synthase